MSEDHGSADRPLGPDQRGGQAVPRDKYDVQKRSLQRMVLVMLEGGALHGLTLLQVRALDDALRVLGWIPAEIKV